MNITSSTSSIGVIVDVNEGINCDTSQLSTRTTISDESRVINMNTSAFKDQVIIFEPPSPGDYTCSISIMSGNIVLKSMEKPCSNTDTSSKLVPIICDSGVELLFHLCSRRLFKEYSTHHSWLCSWSIGRSYSYSCDSCFGKER